MNVFLKNQINNLNISYLHSSYQNKEELKALASFLFIKNTHPSSVIKNFSIELLRQLTYHSFRVAKRQFELWQSMELCKYDKKSKTLYLSQIRNREYNKYNIKLNGFDLSSPSKILKCLQSYFICYKCEQMEYKRNEINVQTDIINGNVSCSKTKRKNIWIMVNSCGAKALHFEDNGISYNYIAQELGISKTTVANAIKYGIAHNFFSCQHRHETIYVGKKDENLNIYVEMNKHRFKEGFIYATKFNTVVHRMANRYSNIYSETFLGSNNTIVNIDNKNSLNVPNNALNKENDIIVKTSYNNTQPYNEFDWIPKNYSNDLNAYLEQYNVVTPSLKRNNDINKDIVLL